MVVDVASNVLTDDGQALGGLTNPGFVIGPFVVPGRARTVVVDNDAQAGFIENLGGVGIGLNTLHEEFHLAGIKPEAERSEFPVGPAGDEQFRYNVMNPKFGQNVLLDSLAPEGHLEETLAERVALVFWRLQRLARYEREAIANAQDLIGDDLAMAASYRGETLPKKPTPEIIEKIDRMLAARLLPDEYTLNKIMRYEAHLNRQLYQALHELEALQARRQGQAAPLARIDLQAIAET